MHDQRSYPIRAPAKFVYEWMTTPGSEDTAYTLGLTSRKVTETWKFQNTSEDKGTIAGLRYTSKAVLRKYPPSRWRVEEEAGAWYHRTEFAIADTPDGTELKTSMEIIVRGWRRYFGKSFRKRFSDDFGARVRGWVSAIEEAARAMPADAFAPTAPKKKAEAPRDIPKQYGS